MKEKTLHDKLVDIQQRLKVGKDQNNEFGGFKYRSIEDIEEGVKPLLKEHSLTLCFSDEPVMVGERVYIKATAVLSDSTTEVSTSAYARESATPKAKMDDAQLTGSCSSYARKYAAGGLFLLDNTKDADSYSHTPLKAKPIRDTELDKMKAEIWEQIQAHGIEVDDVTAFIHSVIGQDTVTNAVHAKQVLKALKDKTDKEV